MRKDTYHVTFSTITNENLRKAMLSINLHMYVMSEEYSISRWNTRWAKMSKVDYPGSCSPEWSEQFLHYVSTQMLHPKQIADVMEVLLVNIKGEFLNRGPC